MSVLQYAENLTDRQAAQAVRCRIDWKYWLAAAGPVKRRGRVRTDSTHVLAAVRRRKAALLVGHRVVFGSGGEALLRVWRVEQ